VFAGVEHPVSAGGHADPIDAQQGAVEDHGRLASGDFDRLGERGCHRSEHGERLAHVPVDSRGANLESACQVGIGLAPAQVGHHQQGLAAGGQFAPAGRPLIAMRAQGIGEQAERAAGHGHPGRVRQHLEAPGQAS
jgi:hypothetical protein